MMDRRTFLLSAGALALTGCATRPASRGVYEATEIPIPTYRTGDRWTYRRTDGYNGLPRGTLTRTVEAVNDDGIHIVMQDAEGRIIDDARFESPGVQLAGTLSEDGPMIGTFAPAYRKYDFPLTSGKSWKQAFNVRRTDPWGTRNYVTASMYTEGWEDLRVGDQTHRALVMRRALNLGQKSFFEGTLYRYEIEWYVPAIRGFARLETSEQFYRLRNQVMGALENGDRFIYELESFELA